MNSACKQRAERFKNSLTPRYTDTSELKVSLHQEFFYNTKFFYSTKISTVKIFHLSDREFAKSPILPTIV